MKRVLLVVLLASACGGGGGGSGAPLTPAELAAMCRDLCAHAVTCGWETRGAAVCETECNQDGDMYRAAVADDIAGCYVGLACNAMSQLAVCFSDAIAAAEALSVHEDYAARCAARHAECMVALPISVCDAEEVKIFSAAYMTREVLPCLDLACAQIAACLDEKVLDAY